MVASGEIRKDDIGLVFRATIKDGNDIVNVSSASVKKLKFMKPSSEVLTKDASLFTNGTDGVIQYTTVSGDLNELGTWQIQGRVEFGESQQYNSSIEKFKVHRNLS